MSVGPAGEADFLSWDAGGWDDLRLIWAALAPESEDDPPTFRSVVLAPQQRGWVFERWVMEAFRLSGATTDHRHANPRAASGRTLEEIDGLIYEGWQAFLVEAKAEGEPITIDPIYRLHLMAEQRPVGTMGLIFSLSRFTGPAEELAERLRPIRVLLFDRLDIAATLRAGESMMDLVRRRWIFAIRSGRPFEAKARARETARGA